MNNTQIYTRQTQVTNELGMHARPASQIARMAAEAVAPVWLSADVQKVDATSIIDILSLSAVKGTRIMVEIEDKADEIVLEQIVEFFEAGFGEN